MIRRDRGQIRSHTGDGALSRDILTGGGHEGRGRAEDEGSGGEVEDAHGGLEAAREPHEEIQSIKRRSKSN